MTRRDFLATALLLGLPRLASAQGPALIVPNVPAITFKLDDSKRFPVYRYAINAQGQTWQASCGTTWVSLRPLGSDLYISVTSDAWLLGPRITHSATVAIQTPTGASARVLVQVIRSTAAPAAPQAQ